MLKNIIVVGAPRSGTSLAASIFARQGYFVADDEAAQLRAPGHFNPGGYWEAEPLIEANVSLFQRAGFEHHNTWMFAAIDPDTAARIPDLEPLEEHRDLVAHYNARRPWVWKDPRLCFTLGYWWPLVDAASTAVLLVRRQPQETFNSFLRLGWRENTESDREETFARIAAHIGAAKDALRTYQIPHVEIDYAEYRESPQRVADALSGLSGKSIGVEHLGFSENYSSSTRRGRLRVMSEKIIKFALPLPLRKFLRRLVPHKLLQTLFPGR